MLTYCMCYCSVFVYNEVRVCVYVYVYTCMQAVYSVLKEAEHRSMTPAPYWDIPLANQVINCTYKHQYNRYSFEQLTVRLPAAM
jgi:hypothetical protein